MKQTLTITREDYIRAIYKLNGFQAGAVRVGDLAKHLKLAKSTVSERIRELIAVGFVTLDGTGYALTKKGIAVAEKLTYKHRIIESFLHEILGVPSKALHEEAHLLEHACSDDVIARMARKLGNPKQDPHGQPIKK